jgi:hypothetical protein
VRWFLAATLVVFGACGGDHLAGPDSTIVTAETATSTSEPSTEITTGIAAIIDQCKSFPTPTPAAQWLVDFCPLMLAPIQVLLTQMLPAITGENALPPDGNGFDYDAIAAACSHIAPTLVPLGASARTLPTSLEALDEPLRAFVDEFQSFVDACPQRAANQDRIALRDGMRDVGAAAQELIDRFGELGVPVHL